MSLVLLPLEILFPSFSCINEHLCVCKLKLVSNLFCWVSYVNCCFISIWADIQRQNEQRCEQEIEDIKREIKSGNITPDSSLIRFSDEALDEQKHSIGIADEKVMLAVRAYDLVCGSPCFSIHIITVLVDAQPVPILSGLLVRFFVLLIVILIKICFF